MLPLRTLDPTAATGSARAGARALRLFHEAARRVPAYRDFLKKAGVKAETIRTLKDFRHVPETDKPSYFSRYSLEELSWDGSLADAKYVSTSSGSTGVPFFWPRGEEQDVVTGLIAERIWRGLFEATAGSTLFVNSFSLGTWIAGMEFFNSARWTAERGTKLTIVSPGIDKHEAVRQIQKLAPFFSRTVLAGYPPFVKDILDHGTASGVDWKRMDLKLFVAGESISESWRDSTLALMGHPKSDPARIINLYGMAEAGMTAHDTPVSILLRRELETLGGTYLPEPARVTGLYQYYPSARYFEVVDGDSLLLSANAGLPLIRYSTRDSGGIIEYAALMKEHGPALMRAAARAKVDLTAWRMPFVYLHGRKDLSLSLYAVNIYIENVKYALEHSASARRLSGLFTMSVGHEPNLDPRFDITIELEDRGAPRARLTEQLAEEIVSAIASVNSEYAKLYSVVGEKARPHVTLVPRGALDTLPGRKHRWVKREPAA